jgi:hypothetical protein
LCWQALQAVSIMAKSPPTIFSRAQTSAKWARARSRSRRAETARYLTSNLAEELADRIDFMQMTPSQSLVVGDTSGTLETDLSQRGSIVTEAALDAFDAEAPSQPHSYDLFIHLMGLGMVNDLPGALIHARNRLKEGAVFFAAFPGAGSLPVLRELSMIADGDRPAARMHPLVDNRAGTALLERAGFARQVVDSYAVKVRFSSLDRLVEDLRDHGLTNSLASQAPVLTREGWRRAHEAFDARKDADGKVTETFEMLVLTGWR